MDAEFPKAAEPHKRKRRWFQFSLRTLMIVVAVLAVACGYLAKEAETVRMRRAFIESHPEYRYSPFFFRQAPSWIRGLLGDESFNVVALPIEATKQQRDLASTVLPEAKIFAINRTSYIRFPNHNRDAMPVDFVPFSRRDTLERADAAMNKALGAFPDLNYCKQIAESFTASLNRALGSGGMLFWL